MNLDTANARKAIFSRIRHNKTRHEDHPVTPRRKLDVDDAATRLADHPRNLQPAVAIKAGDAAIAQFIEKAKSLESEIIPVQSPEEVPALAADWLKRRQLPLRASLSADLQGLDWASAEIAEETGPLSPDIATAITSCRAGLAETGGMVMASSAGHGAGQNFVPDTHFVVLKKSQIVSGWEDAFDLFRDENGKTVMPRALSFIAGPSRTGDIEFTIELGAHGPRALVIFLVEDGVED